MANSYINQGQKPRAWKVLQEAAKCEYDNWKVWDNILLVSTDCAHFEEVIRAYHRLLDLKNGKHVDGQVLSILVRAISENLLDNYDRPCLALKKAALELFGRLVAENSGESKIWELYAQLVVVKDLGSEQVSEEDLYKAAQFLQRATATFMQRDKDWVKSTDKVNEGLALSVKYVQGCIDAAQASTNKASSIQQMSSAKMTLKSMLSKIKVNNQNNLEKFIHT